MRMAKSLIPLIALLCVWGLAPAAGTTANLSWTAPTAYTDGTTLPPADIAFYTISWTINTTPGNQSKVVNAPALTTTVPVLCGTASFTITVTTTATAMVPNSTSAATGPVPYVSGVTCAPNPPGNLKAS